VGNKARRRAADQRPNGEWRLARRRVDYSPLAPSKRPQTSRSSSPVRHMDRWVLRCLGVRTRRAYGELAWCTRDVARERALASRGEKQFADAVFKIDFLWISKLKCTLQYIAKLKITHSSTTFTKAGRGLDQ
jgi:hypothetical protein